MTCTKTGTAKAGQYANEATATGKDTTGKTVTDKDPSHYYGGKPGIDVEKSTNNQDADSGTGPVVAVGSTVTWKYVVKNTGNIKLTNVKVTDNKEGAISCPKTELNSAESMTCTKTGVAKAGQYSNEATATGKDTTGKTVTDKDPSHYYGGKPGIDVEKSTNNQDADSGTGPVVAVGSTVTWKYVVKNTGNIKLTNVKVTDNKEGTISCPKTELNPAESMTCTKTGTAKAGQYENEATVTGKPPVGTTVTDKDPSHYYGKALSCLGDFVWQDKNSNGIQDASESGIAGAKVELLDASGNTVKDFYGNTVAPKTTGNDGKYKFCKLSDGKYIVKVTPPIGYVISPKDVGSDDAKDSDVAPTTGKTNIITLPEGANDMKWDAGVYKPEGCLGNFIWLDKNANGIQDSGEAGVKGAKVELLDENGNPAKDGYGDAIAPQTTPASGEYKFCKLDGGKYIVKVTPPAGYEVTPKDAGSDNAKDSDIDPSTGKTAVITLPTAGSDMTWDGGLYKPACIGDFVWLDYNGNGIQDNDSKEIGIEGAVVTLMDAQGNSVTDINGNAVAPQTTGTDGKYQFCNLKPGSYKVKMLKDDPLYYVTYKDKGNNEAKDSDINPSNYTTDAVTITSGDNYKDLDGGYFKCGSLIGVYSVMNMGMGAYSVDSGILDGLLVTIYDENGDVVQEITTDTFGRFKAKNLLPGKYKMVFQQPKGMKFAKDKTVYITVRAGQKDIKVENIVAPKNAKDEDIKKELKKKEKLTLAADTQVVSDAIVGSSKSSMGALTPIAMLIMILSIFTLARSRD